jgi:hypothetical protein
MPLVRGAHSFDDNFTQIPNDWVRDSRLSLKARGLLVMLMSHRQGWSLTIGSIAKDSQEGKDAIRSAIAELEKFGYLEREQKNENGRFGETIWTTKEPSDFPLSDYPLSENPLYKNNNIKENNIKNTISDLEPKFEEFWNLYPRKVDKAKAFRAFRSALKKAKFEDIIAGAIAYRNDPTRNPDFTKYPASWLNACSWENAATLPEARAAYADWLAKERDRTNRYIEEMRELEKRAAPMPESLRKELGL